MILCGQQPNFLPWIGLFHKVSLADGFVLVDHVQYVKRSVVNRCRILSPAGEPLLLTVPVLTSGRRYQRIRDVEIDDRGPWRRKHLRSLSLCYGRAPHYREHLPFFEDLYSRRGISLSDFNAAGIEYLLHAFGLPPPAGRSSEKDVSGARTGLLVALCRAFGADTYLSGAGARKYVDPALFREAGLAHRFQDFRHPSYRQGSGRRPFVPRLSAVDLLFWEGAAAAEILRGCGGLA